jgi:ankyrin repeat protein
MYACRNGDAATAELLITEGADVDAKEKVCHF